MSEYSMSQIAVLTGIKAHTLRKWESRYDFLKPHRTESNIRYYSDAHLKKLLCIGMLIQKGVKISHINKMSELDINEVLLEDFDHVDQGKEIKGLVVSMLEMNEALFDQILNAKILKSGLLGTIINVLYPFLNQVGLLWDTSKIMPAQEHFISNLIRQKIFTSINNLPSTHDSTKSIIMFLPEGEHHEIGLLLAWYIAKQLGWKVYYLGQDVPFENVSKCIDMIKPDKMLTMITTPLSKKAEEHLYEFIIKENMLLYMAGKPLSHISTDQMKLIQCLERPEALVDTLQ